MRLDQLTRRRVLKQVVEVLRVKAVLDMDLVQTDDHEIFPREPHSLAGSKSAFVYAKMDRSDKLGRLLQAKPNLVYQFDA